MRSLPRLCFIAPPRPSSIAPSSRNPYSHFLGVNVAIVGFAWFAVVVLLALLGKRFPSEYLLLPLWGVAAIFVLYLIFIQIFVLNPICTYCTLAHILALVLGLPIAKISLAPEPWGEIS